MLNIAKKNLYSNAIQLIILGRKLLSLVIQLLEKGYSVNNDGLALLRKYNWKVKNIPRRR
jgi:hypothetical protein